MDVKGDEPGRPSRHRQDLSLGRGRFYLAQTISRFFRVCLINVLQEKLSGVVGRSWPHPPFLSRSNQKQVSFKHWRRFNYDVCDLCLTLNDVVQWSDSKSWAAFAAVSRKTGGRVLHSWSTACCERKLDAKKVHKLGNLNLQTWKTGPDLCNNGFSFLPTATAPQTEGQTSLVATLVDGDERSPIQDQPGMNKIRPKDQNLVETRAANTPEAKPVLVWRARQQQTVMNDGKAVI